MSTADTATGVLVTTRPSSAYALGGSAPIPRPALGAALNKQRYCEGRVERHVYSVTDGTYRSALLSTRDGDAPEAHTKETTMNGDLGVWTHEGCALMRIDYHEEMFEAVRSETPADLAELDVRRLAKTAEAFDATRPI